MTVFSPSPLVRTLVAPNPGPFTAEGTNTAIIGRGRVAIIDPGPHNTEHLEALLKAVDGETVTHIVVTHTHRDHSPLARAVKEHTGALIVGCGAHRLLSEHLSSADNPLDAATDHAHAPDVVLREGDVIEGAGWTLETLETPGHTLNHLSFALREERVVFSGDHVMGWSSSIIAPPEGSMGDYMRSLQRLIEYGDARYYAGHGAPVEDGTGRAFQLLQHRQRRHNDIAELVRAGVRDAAKIVERLYRPLDPRLQRAATLTVQAHLIELGAVEI